MYMYNLRIDWVAIMIKYNTELRNSIYFCYINIFNMH